MDSLVIPHSYYMFVEFNYIYYQTVLLITVIKGYLYILLIHVFNKNSLWNTATDLKPV